MNTDNSIESLIIKYLSGQASAEEKELLISWIKESPENRLQFKELQNIWQGLNPPFDPDEIEVEKIQKDAVAKHRKETLIKWAKIIGTVATLGGILAAAKPLILFLLANGLI